MRYLVEYKEIRDKDLDAKRGWDLLSREILIENDDELREFFMLFPNSYTLQSVNKQPCYDTFQDVRNDFMNRNTNNDIEMGKLKQRLDK